MQFFLSDRAGKYCQLHTWSVSILCIHSQTFEWMKLWHLLCRRLDHDRCLTTVALARLHVTFALRMNKIEQLDRLEQASALILTWWALDSTSCPQFWSQVCGNSAPVELKVKEFFLSHVDRIRQGSKLSLRAILPDALRVNSTPARDAEVYCIGARFLASCFIPAFRGS